MTDAEKAWERLLTIRAEQAEAAWKSLAGSSAIPAAQVEDAKDRMELVKAQNAVIRATPIERRLISLGV